MFREGEEAMEIIPISMFDILSQGVWTMLVVALPVLGVAMVVGLLIGILQTATSIQEQTLIFIPKILAVFLFILLIGSWMAARILTFTREILGQLERFIQ
jgi:flagellar biosynthetic protein FliQ